MASDLVLLTSWTDPGRRKLEAVRACADRDVGTLLSLLNAYLSARSRKRARTSERTRATYELGVRTWIEFCWPDLEGSPETPLLRATVDDVDLFVATLQADVSAVTGKPYAPSTIATYLSSVRTFYRALEWAGATAVNPADRSFAPSDPRPPHERRPAVDPEAYHGLCARLAGDDALSRRDHVMVRLFGDAGMRVSEVVALDVEDVDLASQTLFIRHGKGGRSATQFLTRRLVEALGAWLAIRSAHAAAGERAVLVNVGEHVPEAFLGRRLSDKTVRRTLNALYREAGLPLRFRGSHTLRHTAGTRYYRATQDLHRTRDFMRHANIATTAIYAKMDRAMVLEGVRALDREEDDG
jgi:integrase/recombinase XerC